ncbi:hypothetical protein FGO68_gene15263 [Halteria grandinella]|uniref:Uncharacterized protein n=1 Tax=Halteria grandinella TaxID=5974 RepID=A0A8J8P2M4_HALGN|nr:hypothetical protein FGO68_gene15263 [Halteria grandinella]
MNKLMLNLSTQLVGSTLLNNLKYIIWSHFIDQQLIYWMSQYQGRRSATSSQAASYQPTKGYTYGGGTAYTHTEEGAAFRKNKRRGGYEQSTQSNSGYMPRQQASSSTYEDEGLRYPHSCQKSEHFTQSVTTSKIESSSPSKQASNYQGTDQYQQSFGVANDSASNHYYGHENHYAEDVSSDQYSCQQNAQRKQSQLYGDDSRHGYKCKSKISETSNRRDSHLGPKNSQSG